MQKIKTNGEWSCGWQWDIRYWRVWYWCMYYDGYHHVVNIGPFQIEYYC